MEKSKSYSQMVVDNVQKGVDDCGEYYVSEEQLQELKETCEKVLKKHTLAEKLLPTGAGFFFGGTEYDEYYFKDIEETLEALNKILVEGGKTGEFYYQSSW